MKEALRLATLCGLGILDTPADPIFDALVHELAATLRVRGAMVSFMDAERQWYKARIGVDVAFIRRDVSFCQYTLRGDAVMVVPDATLDPRFATSPFVVSEPHIRFYAGAPILARNRARVGTVCVFDPRPRTGLTQREQRLLMTMAARVTAVLEPPLRDLAAPA